MCRLYMKETTNISQSELFKNERENWYKKYNKNHMTMYKSYIESYPLACVDAQFCPGYRVYFHFGPRAHLWRISNLGLEPCPFLLYQVFESFCISYLFRVYFVSNRYLSCCVVSYRAIFFVFIYVKCHFIYLIVS